MNATSNLTPATFGAAFTNFVGTLGVEIKPISVTVGGRLEYGSPKARSLPIEHLIKVTPMPGCSPLSNNTGSDLLRQMIEQPRFFSQRLLLQSYADAFMNETYRQSISGSTLGEKIEAIYRTTKPRALDDDQERDFVFHFLMGVYKMGLCGRFERMVSYRTVDHHFQSMTHFRNAASALSKSEGADLVGAAICMEIVAETPSYILSMFEGEKRIKIENLKGREKTDRTNAADLWYKASDFLGHVGEEKSRDFALARAAYHAWTAEDFDLAEKVLSTSADIYLKREDLEKYIGDSLRVVWLKLKWVDRVPLEWSNIADILEHVVNNHDVEDGEEGLAEATRLLAAAKKFARTHFIERHG